MSTIGNMIILKHPRCLRYEPTVINTFSTTACGMPTNFTTSKPTLKKSITSSEVHNTKRLRKTCATKFGAGWRVPTVCKFRSNQLSRSAATIFIRGIIDTLSVPHFTSLHYESYKVCRCLMLVYALSVGTEKA